MTAIFENVLHMSAVGGIVIIAVLIARLCLKKAPKFYSYLLWAIVLLRLLCPFTVESPVSAIPEGLASDTAMGELYQPYDESYAEAPSLEEPVIRPYPGESGKDESVEIPQIDIGDGQGNMSAGSIIQAPAARPDWGRILAILWLCGMAVMVAWAVTDYLRLRLSLRTAIREEKDVYTTDAVDSPFLLGLIRPKIYLPAALEPREREYILLHERCHLRRGDHWIKLLAFAALSLHWFNPLVWLAFVLSSRDMEMSCDEAVIRSLGGEVRADYSASLLALATGRRRVAVTPLAFGEGDPKGRIRNLASWKKPTVWIIIAAVAVCIVAAVCLLTDPMSGKAQIMVEGYVYTHHGERIEEIPAGSMEKGTLRGILHNSDKPPYGDLRGTNLDEKYAGQPIYQNVWDKIYLYDEEGFCLVFEIEEDEPLEQSLVAEGDFDHDGRGDYLYVTCEADIYRIRLADAETREVLWEESAETAHVGWNSILTEKDSDGHDWLLRYNPYMNNGIAGYSLELFTIKNGREAVSGHWECQFEAGNVVTQEMSNFRTTANSLLYNATLLLSTLGGTPVIGPIEAARAGLYPLELKAGDSETVFFDLGASVLSSDKYKGGLSFSRQISGVKDGGHFHENAAYGWYDSGDSAAWVLRSDGEYMQHLTVDGMSWTWAPDIDGEVWEWMRNNALEPMELPGGFLLMGIQPGKMALQEVRGSDDGGFCLHYVLPEDDIHWQIGEEVASVSCEVYFDENSYFREARLYVHEKGDEGRTVITTVSTDSDAVGKIDGVYDAYLSERSRTVKSELGFFELLETVKAEDFTELWPFEALDRASLAEMLRSLGEPVSEGDSDGLFPEWSLEAYLEGGGEGLINSAMRHLELACGLDENLVLVRLRDSGRSQSAWFESEALYTALRHMNDYEELIEEAAWEQAGYVAQATMLHFLDMNKGNPMEFQRAELTRLVYLGGYDHPDGSRVDIYDFCFALVPAELTTRGLAGGMYIDSALRVQGFGPTHLALKHGEGRDAEYAVMYSDFNYTGGEVDENARSMINSILKPAPGLVDAEDMEELCLSALEDKMGRTSLHFVTYTGYGIVTDTSEYWIDGMDWYCHVQGQGAAYAQLTVDNRHYETDGGARNDVGLWYGPETIGGRPMVTVARDGSERSYLRTETWPDGSYDVCFDMEKLESFGGEQSGTTERFCFSADGELKSVIRVTEVPDGIYNFELVFLEASRQECRTVIDEAHTGCIESIKLREGVLSESGYRDNGELMFSVPFGESVVVKLSGGSVEDVVMQDMDMWGNLKLVINGMDHSEEALSWINADINPEIDHYPEYYLLRPYSGAGLLICVYDDGPSGDPRTHLFEYDGTLHYRGFIPCHPSRLTLDGKGNVYGPARLDVFQTWHAEHTWSLGGAMVQELARDFYFVENFTFRSYTVGVDYYPPAGTSPLLVDVYAYAEMDASSQRWIQGAGTELAILGTDNKEWLLVRDGTGEEYYLHLCDINGTDIETPAGETIGIEVFRGLNYAD